MLKLSGDKRYALLETDTEMSVRTNIMLQREDVRIYAKVIKHGPDGYLVCFTSAL